MKNVLKALMLSEGIAVLVGLFSAFGSIYLQKETSKHYNYGNENYWIYNTDVLTVDFVFLFVMRGLLSSVYIPLLCNEIFVKPSENYHNDDSENENYQDRSGFALFKAPFRHDRIINSVSEVLLLH